MFKKGSKLDKAFRKIDKGADNITRSVDNSVARAIGMPEGTSFGSLLKPDSEYHKETVNFFKGVETTSSAPVSAEERKDSEGRGESTVSTPAPVTQAQAPTLEASAPSATPEPSTRFCEQKI